MLNYPIETEEAKQFWSSSNICNRVRAICAFSLDEENANMNLCRMGYANDFRKKVLRSVGIIFNDPSMVNHPYNYGNEDIWDNLSIGGSAEDLILWSDDAVWDDVVLWEERDENIQ